MKQLGVTTIDTRAVKRIQGAEYYSDDRGGGVFTAWSAQGVPVARFTFVNGNTSAAMERRAAGTEVYRDGYGYFGDRAHDLEPVFTAGGATYYRKK